MKILLIEDELAKRELIEQALHALRPDIIISCGRTVQQAIHLLREDKYDLIVLDMSLPSRESRPGGAQPVSQPTGGVEVLLELHYEERTDRVVIVTQYPDIEFDKKLYPLAKAKQLLAKSLTVQIFDVIHFKPREQDWRDQLGKAIS